MNYSAKIKPTTKDSLQLFIRSSNYTVDDIINAGIRYLNNKQEFKPSSCLVMKIYEPEKKIVNPFKPKRQNGKTIYPVIKERNYA